jgi:hypothetical protein
MPVEFAGEASFKIYLFQPHPGRTFLTLLPLATIHHFLTLAIK